MIYSSFPICRARPSRVLIRFADYSNEAGILACRDGLAKTWIRFADEVSV
jgi:hypothetical protein